MTTTIREQVTAELPDNANVKTIPFGIAATWTTPGAVWQLSYANIPITPLVVLRGEGFGVKVHVTIAHPTAETIIGTMRLHGAIPAAPDPAATVRQLAQELTTIDQLLIGAGVDYPHGAKGVAALATAYRNRLQANCTHGADCQVHPDANAVHNFDAEPSSVLDDARVPVPTAPCLKTGCDETTCVGPACDETVVAQEDADPGRPADMMPATGGLIPPGEPIRIGGDTGCVIDVQQSSHVINDEFRSALRHELTKQTRHRY